MNKKIIIKITALFIAILFFLYVVSPNNGFNLIFYSIHELISPGGKGEFGFIRTCDVLIRLLVYFISFKLIKIVTNSRN